MVRLSLLFHMSFPYFLLVKDSPSIRGIGKWLYHQVKERREVKKKLPQPLVS